MARARAMVNLLVPGPPPAPEGMSGPPLSADMMDTPNYDRDALGGITTRSPICCDDSDSAPSIDQGLSSRRRLKY